MDKIGKKIGFLGCGNMACAIISGLLLKKAISASDIIASDNFDEKIKVAKKNFKIKTTKDNNLVVKESDVIILAVKPQVLRKAVEDVCAEIKKKVFISIAAGIQTSFIENILKKRAPVIRVMPNIPALVGQGISCICAGRFARVKDLNIAKKIFLCVGKVEQVEEQMIDAVTSISGSGPAYFFYVCEAMIECAKEFGFSDGVARAIVIQTIKGSSILLEKTGENPEVLRQKVASKGGTTESAIDIFEKNKLKNIIKKAVSAAYNRSKQLAR